MDQETHRSPINTEEFIALWNTVKEEHYVNRLLPLLPRLFGGTVTGKAESQEITARYLVRALHLAAMPEAGVHTAIDYLQEAVGGQREASASSAGTVSD